MNSFHLVVIALAATRLSTLLQNDYGLFGVFEKLRVLVGVNENKEGGIVGEDGQPNQLAAILSCIYCISLWVSIFLTVGYYFFPVQVFWICLPFALSQLVILVEMKL